MQTNFTDEQLQNPRLVQVNEILRKCVHCGFCTATCPTYNLLGDELDGPRGRIYLIKQMLEEDRPATPDVAKHVDRCLSCLSCMTTCPSSVNYMHLVDEARVHIEKTMSRPLPDRLIRSLLAFLLPHSGRFGFALRMMLPFRPLIRLFCRALRFKRLSAMLALAPNKMPSMPELGGAVGTYKAQGQRRGRVVLLAGCAQKVLAPDINAATIRLLNRLGIEVVVSKGAGCCGALTHHMGKEGTAQKAARRNIDAWLIDRLEDGGLDAVIVNASGCGTTVKNYDHLLRFDGVYHEKAQTISALTCDITEYLANLDLGNANQAEPLRVSYHSACSLQHGQKITQPPKDLLKKAGFTVVDIPDGHLCCGSAGTYNILQPSIAIALRDNKVANIARTKPDVIAAGNLGCITQIKSGTATPIVHTVELLDWATGGPKPQALLENQN